MYEEFSAKYHCHCEIEGILIDNMLMGLHTCKQDCVVNM